mmetsp:Transcript_43456/g.82922  ORF Transcript_43456/g.82922 Transcript_43456/m.82922 type:complete len:293 (-) Transcript_43456:213-1091(-)|eukprot:CAMPEP_0114260556 /NCGR_PEP_ID=MMETSP0058-20121206/20564_1 /TAXON_ID=36894 /ORGANISM="Pyramimonas parkeae, CCMP726" /LENGTH=292 /DNA_ID=CAMNT_0001375827 /DNA_START=528 /DNA_END=1406 /DNA_ORIENTATION=+
MATVEVSTEATCHSNGESKTNARQRKTPKLPRGPDGPEGPGAVSKPILQRLESSKPAPLDMGTIRTGLGASGFSHSPHLIDSSKPAPHAQYPARDAAPFDSDTDLALAALVAALILALVTCFLDMEFVITRGVRILVPVSMQTQTLQWAQAANLEVALWASCSVVQACLVWGVYIALYGALGAALGLLPGASSGFTVAVARFRQQAWAAGTVLHQVDPGVACAATVCIILLSLGMAHFLDSKRRRNLPPRAGWQDAHRVGWCSPDALLSLHISPITRVRNSPSPTTGSRLSM